MARQLDGGDYLLRTDPTEIDPTANFTCGFSFRRDNLSTFVGLFAVGDPDEDTARGFSVVSRANANIEFRYFGGVALQSSAAAVSDDTWHRAGVRYTASGAQVQLVLDGTAVAGASGDGIGALTSGDAIAFGPIATLIADQGLVGGIAGAFWLQGVTLSAADIDTYLQDLCSLIDDYGPSGSVIADALKGLWLFQSADPGEDISGLGNDLTDTGSASQTDPAWVPSSCGAGGPEALTCSPGSVAITGASAGLNATRVLVSQAGSVAITGTSAGLNAARQLVTQAGSVAITGTAAGLHTTRQLVAQTGSMAITGTSSGLNALRQLVAQAGSVAITGTAAGLNAGRVLISQAGSVVLTGTDATLTVSTIGPQLVCEPGAFTITGQSAGLNAQRVLTGQPGSVTVTGSTAGLQATRRLIADPGSVVIAGTAATLRAARRLIASPGAVAITGTDAVLTYSNANDGTPGTHPLSVTAVALIKSAQQVARIKTATLEH